ncbi:MAG TPA: DUF4395 family protein [Acidimicrobiia bacterium]|jgi:small-conductance mechanosensitive channel
MAQATTPPQSKGIDERQLRFERGLAAVLLFGGYVWKRDLVIPLVAIGITMALVTVIGVRPFGVPFERLIAPRLRAARRFVPQRLAHSDDLTLALVLAVATLFILIGLSTVPLLIGLAVALIAMFEAAAGLWVGAPLANWLRARAKSKPRPRG